jgi:Homeodomain-like domain
MGSNHATKKRAESTEVTVLEPQQHRFIERLLAGQTITEAARHLGISRRTATYWLKDNALVRAAYERERLRMADEFRSRIARLHDLALSTLEEALSPDTPLSDRLSVARFLYAQHLAQYATIAPLVNADTLVEAMFVTVTDPDPVEMLLHPPPRREMLPD